MPVAVETILETEALILRPWQAGDVAALVKIALGVAVSIYLGLCVLLYVFQARFLYPGAFMPIPPGIEAAGRADGLEASTLRTADGQSLHVLHRAPEHGRPVVLLFHGNASYPEDYRFLYAGWKMSGYGVVAPVARGYPRSTGAPRGDDMLADAIAARDWLADRYPGHPVVVLGQSLGTGAAVHVAAQRDVDGVILISPFTSMLALVAEKLPWIPGRLLLASPFRSDLDIGRVTAPILIFHGDRDTLIPIEHARILAAMAKAPTTIETIRGAGHAQGLFAPAMIDRMNSFIGRLAP